VATSCSEWICRMRGGLAHHTIIIPPALSLPLLRGAAVGRAPTIFQIDLFCTRISNFFQSPICSIARIHSHTKTSTSKQHSCVQGPLWECRSIWSGASGLPYYCTPPVTIPAVFEVPAMWRCNNQKKKLGGLTFKSLSYTVFLSFLLL